MGQPFWFMDIGKGKFLVKKKSQMFGCVKVKVLKMSFVLRGAMDMLHG
jgi:hypothetical protein